MGVEKLLKKIKKGKIKSKDIDLSKLSKKDHDKIYTTIMHNPLKSKPCKGCPALDKGICKCARKLLK